MGVKTYSPKLIQTIVGGNIITGYADGVFVTAERAENSFNKHVGGDGEVGRVQSANKSGMMVITLAQYSPSNDILSALNISDELTGNGVVPVILKDANGTTLLFSGEGWIMKPANVEYGNTMSGREWTIEMAQIDYFVGGNS